MGACAISLLPVGCSRPLEPPAAAEVLDALPPVVLETVRFSGYRGPAEEYEVHAARADVRTEDRLAELRGVQIQFRDEERGPMRVTADRAELNLATDAFVLHENVRGELGGGERFETSEVRYDETTRRLYTDRPVQIERGRFSFRGEGMVIDVPTRRMTLNEPAGETK